MADTRRAEKPARPIPHLQWTCRKCETMDGVSTAATMRIRQGGYVSLKTGRMTGGNFYEVCAMCLARGRTTIVAKG
ncbi:hypothetical protein [Methylobacterium sp. ARG-1]|uniref:hypothetical protein n=1 Tax=Methylobacterium sp. ARG-1 TaxID=1692501 RepID=UPI0006822277|nr:hypothetical protein [Methylobacterium sp. ARG-1]KNY20369.1 hypothetical protein AKJ13_22315 [Methylobacterium sp. ARG-1]